MTEPIVKILLFYQFLGLLRALNCSLLSNVEFFGLLIHHFDSFQLILPLLLQLLLPGFPVLFAVRASELLVAVVGVLNEVFVLLLRIPLTRIYQLVAVLNFPLVLLFVLGAVLVFGLAC